MKVGVVRKFSGELKTLQMGTGSGINPVSFPLSVRPQIPLLGFIISHALCESHLIFL